MAVKKRCKWAGSDPLMIAYHDNEWGRPEYKSRKLFEFLILEGMQAGLSWATILKKRANFKKAFDNFDPKKIAVYKNPKINQLLKDAGIIRNRLKIESAISNARAFLELEKQPGGFSKYIWSFVNGKPVINKWKKLKDIPAETEIAREMSKDLKKRGFRFVGPTICYAFMQAVGMVNDHTTDCFRYKQVQISK
jgi:DNA-3-methyladenine glycosylase I